MPADTWRSGAAAGPASEKPESVRALQEIGASLWLDALSREILDNGSFARLVQERGVSGVTSNPTTFHSAMDGGSSYDGDIRRFVGRASASPRELYLALATEDVRRAADVLLPVFEATGATDGFVSLQLTPDLAHDAEAMVAQGLALRDQLDRPNTMIKVPATDAGLVAIRALTAAGAHVNVTLLFSQRRWREAVDAFSGGLEDRLSAGRSIAGATSFASVFISRLDAAVDSALPPDSRLRHRAALASAAEIRHAHAAHLSTRRWQRLEAAGARPQRLLWASTAVKDPQLRDVRYVEQLAGPGEVLTLPPTTLNAFLAHGRVPAVREVTDSQRVLRELRCDGIDLDEVAERLEADGVRKFRESYEAVLGLLEAHEATADPVPTAAR